MRTFHAFDRSLRGQVLIEILGKSRHPIEQLEPPRRPQQKQDAFRVAAKLVQLQAE